MATRVSPRRKLTTTLMWPLGVAWTTWHYVWRILPVYRAGEPGELPDDLPPKLPDGVSRDAVQRVRDGTGPLLHRVYRARITGAALDPEGLMALIGADPNRVTPRRMARFHKAEGEEGSMRVGDEFLVHMPGPWNGPVRVVEKRPDGFRLATLDGHLEAGQIEWRAWREHGELVFAVESWSRQGDRLSALLHDRLRMAKEVQLYMWTTVVEHVARLAEGRLVDGVSVNTRHVPREAFG